MGVTKGLAAIQEELAKRTAPSGGGDFADRPKARYAGIKANGGPQKLVFLQEIDEGSPNYSEKNGLAVMTLMHSNPDDWKKSAKCTIDEGECYGCANGWRAKPYLFINVLVDDGNEAPYVAIWNRALGKGSIAATLLAMAGDDDFDLSITDKTFKFTRTGTTKDDTTYTLDALPKPHSLNVEDYELFDLEQYIFTVAPERQEAYYLDGQVASAPKVKVAVSGGSTDVDADW